MKNPLKMTFANYLARLSESELNRRLGTEKAEAYKNGLLDTTKFHAPARGGRYNIEEHRQDDRNALKGIIETQSRGQDGRQGEKEPCQE